MGKTRDTGNLVDNISGTNTGDQDLSGYQATTGKDATGGYSGLTLFKINFKNALNTFTSFFTNANTAARTYTFQDRNGTIADDTDLGLKSDKSAAAYTFGANNTSGTANKTDQAFKDLLELTYAGTIVWTGTTAPSGTATHTYQWTQAGKFVALRINLKYSVAGTANSAISLTLPADCPAPLIPNGYNAADTNLLMGIGRGVIGLTQTGVGTTVLAFHVRINAANNGFLIVGYLSSAANLLALYTTVFYWAA